MHRVVSYQIAEHLDTKQFQTEFPHSPIYFDASELFYKLKQDQYVSIFKYGVVCFLNFEKEETSDFLEKLKSYTSRPIDKKFDEEFIIETSSGTDVFGYNNISISRTSPQVYRLIMLNVAHSSALDYFTEQSRILLETTQYHTRLLEKKGRMGISGINMKKYIGRTLNFKNEIAGNLYIFDSPLVTWDDEYLDKINRELKRIFELQPRYRILKEEIEIIRENLDLFKDLLQHRSSKQLEWIIIILILVEVINLFFEKFWL